MFDLEKFKTGKYYVHLPTRSLFDEVMEFLDDNDVTWITGNSAVKEPEHWLEDSWLANTSDTCIRYVTRIGNEELTYKGIARADKRYFVREGYPELKINLSEDDKIKEIFAVGRLHTDIIKDYIDYKFEEMSMEEIIKMNNSIPNSNVEFVESIDTEEEGDEESYSIIVNGDDYTGILKYDGSFAKYETKQKDLVKSPNHYIGDYGLEVEEVLRNFIPRYEDAYVAHRMASAIEYILRSPLKNRTQDLEKAGYNIQQALEHIRKKEEKWV